MEELSEGTVVAGYTIEGVLGRGGMGIVYRARHPELPRSDALKILPEQASATEEARARFIREADLVATLNHPHIVRVYNRGETDDKRLWIAMELIVGRDAEKEMLDGRMPPQRVVKILGEVAGALDYAHRRNILHRDIKPANFLLSDEDDGRAYLADFGIARALDTVSALTSTGSVMASIPFVAPESLSNHGVVDGRADIYSLGCSAYTLLTGKAPFFEAEKDGVARVMGAHLVQAPPKVTDLVAAPPDQPQLAAFYRAMDSVIAKVMAKDPDNRYQTAREFAAATAQAWETGTAAAPPRHTQPWTAPPQQSFTAPIPGQGPGRTQAMDYPSGHFSGPNPAALPGQPGQLFAGQPFTETPAPAKPKRRRRAVIIGALALVVAVVGSVSAMMLFNGDDTPPYRAQTFDHAHGSTELTAAPRAVAALGPGDADAVLSLGVQPVAMTAPSGLTPSWEQSAVTASPAVLAAINTAAVADAHPDVIIATGDVDDATYEKLAGIAPTITRPAANVAEGWDWQTQIGWIGDILGRRDKADELVNSIRSLQGDLSNQNPAFKSKSVQVVAVSDAGVSEVLIPSFASSYLESLGFRYNQDLAKNSVDTSYTRPIQDLNLLYRIETDYLIVLRTDSAAGNGGYGGMPKQLSTYTGKMIIVDDKDVVAALTGPGGYLATQFLDDRLVSTIASAP